MHITSHPHNEHRLPSSGQPRIALIDALKWAKDLEHQAPHQAHPIKNRLKNSKTTHERRFIRHEDVEIILQEKKSKNKKIIHILIDHGIASEEDITIELTTHFHLPYLPLENYHIESEIAKLIPKTVALEHILIPIDKIGETLMVAMANPLDTDGIYHLKEFHHHHIQIFVSTISDIKNAIGRYYPRTPETTNSQI